MRKRKMTVTIIKDRKHKRIKKGIKNQSRKERAAQRMKFE